MQNYLRHNFNYRRVTRWGDERAVRRAVRANFERLTGLEYKYLKIASPFWESKLFNIKNYATLAPLVPAGEPMRTGAKGLETYELTGVSTNGNVGLPELVLGVYQVILMGVQFGANSVSTLFRGSVSGEISYRKITCVSGASGSVNLVEAVDGQGTRSLSVDHDFSVKDYTTIGVNSNSSGSKVAVNSLSNFDFLSQQQPGISADVCNIFEVSSGDSSEFQFLGGIIVLTADSTWNYNDTTFSDEILETLMLRGWELFQPVAFTDYFIGPAVDDVLITYDPNVSKDEDLMLDLNLFAQLLMTLTFDASQDLEGEGGLFADTWLAYVHLSSVCEALADVTFAGVFIEVLKSGVLDTYVDLIASGYVKVEQLAGFEGRGELAGYGKILRQINAPPLDAQGELEGYLTLNTLIKDGNLSAVGCLGGDQLFLTNVPEYFETTKPAWFYTNEGVPSKVMISVKVAEVLNAEVSFDYEFVPGGSVFIDWIVGEVGTSLVNSLIWGYVGNAEALYTTVSMMAEVHAEYSVSIVQGFLSVHAALLAADQIVNLPTTGDLRKTDLITLKLNLDLITLRR